MKPEIKRLSKLAYLNRQPTLWRHGIPCVEIVPSDDENDLTMSLSPLCLEPLNADYDGDELALYIIHDIEALKEMKAKAFLKNTFRYDSNNEMLSTVRHEALYCCYILTENIIPDYDSWKDNYIELDELTNLFEDFDMWNDHLQQPVKFQDEYFTYGVCLLNKWLGFNKILINKTIAKHESNEVSEILYQFNPDNFYDQLTDFSKRLFFFISSTNHNPTIDVDEMANVVDDKTEMLFEKLPHFNPYLGYYLNEAMIDKCISLMDPKSNLFRLYKSGSRMSKQQLARSCINVGYVADSDNIVIHTPICTHLMKGLSVTDYFLAGPGE